ncbi:unnamed protein product [Linum tenue]|uniref:Uncharacterized protein n=1 Tax=Linum tenue TaxID=586396 RepID=A0AAV0GQ79_9ROSI|nr:unnamed protein product [Linum tenue]
MAVNEDPAEGSIPSISLESLVSTQNGDAFSTEDIAWADSCLVKDPDISAGDWSSINDALLQVLSLAPKSQGSLSGAMNDNGCVGGTVNRVDEETKMKPQHVDSDTSGSFQLGTLLSTYERDNPKETDQSDLLPVDTASSAEDAGVTSSEIFKLWDLGIHSEEEEEDDELKLNRALADSSIQSIAPVVDDPEATRDLKEGALDYLIAGIGDLSIHRHSG